MMIFEDFLRKKKIDPALLSQAQPELFSEFRSHFEQMGEKSFDHTKKFWFNKLRRTYHLKEEPKPAKPLQPESPIAVQATELVSPTTEATGVPATSKPAFKPRFRAPGSNASTSTGQTSPETPAPPDTDSVSESTHGQNSQAKPAFKPRFNSKMIQPADEEPAKGEPQSGTAPKPAFKPRFNEKMVKPVDPGSGEPSAENAEPSAPVQQKPAFKPRFNANLTSSSSDAPAETAPPAEEPKPAPPSPTPAFKPRFNAKLASQEPPAPPEDTETTEETSRQEPAAPAKPAFKPRFNAKMIPKKPDSGDS